jgi:hypothetical protein
MSDAAYTEVSAVEAAAELLETTSRLIDVLDAEIDMLRAMQPDAMQALQEDKIVLAAAFEAQVTRLQAEPEAVEALDPELRAELARATALFKDALAENERSLRAAKQVTDGVLASIVDAAERHAPSGGYAATGEQRAQGPSQPQSLAVNARC